MAAQLERSASSVREPIMAGAMQRSVSSMKESATPSLQRTSSMLKALPSVGHSKETPLPGKVGYAAIRNRNVVIGVLSALLFIAVLPWPWYAYMGPESIAADSRLPTRWSSGSRSRPYHQTVKTSFFGGSKFLVNTPLISVTYHGGPILGGGKGGVLKVYLIYYGTFSASQKATISAFFQSFAGPKSSPKTPTVAGWWAMTKGYKDKMKVSVAQTIELGPIYEDPTYSMKKSLTELNVESLVITSLKSGVVDPTGLYLVLTAADVQVQGFCSNQCGTHTFTKPTYQTKNKVLPYAWVGNSAKQCAGYCAWPYAKPAYGTGPQVKPLAAPNGDFGVDGMIINIATMLVGATTDPYGNGFFEGDATDPLEPASVCAGIYGPNAYPGYAGDLLKDKSGASFNTYGVNGREFLLPWFFNPATKNCAGQL